MAQAKNVIAFPIPATPGPSADELVAQIREDMAAGRMAFDHSHFRERLAKNRVSMRQVMEVLKEGTAVSVPKLDPYGDWRIKLRMKVAGRRVRVVVAVGEEGSTAVTVF